MANETNGGTEGTPGGTAGAPGSAAGQQPQTSALGGAEGTVGGTELAGGQQQAGADGKTAEAAELQLKFPEGVDPKADKTLSAFLPLAKELGLKSEGAQKLVDLYIGQQKASQEAALAAFDAEQVQWREQLRADKEFGGDKYDASLAAARKVMAKHATPEFRKFLNDTGLGNHPELFRFVARLGKAMADDTIGATGSNGASKPKSLAELLYGAAPSQSQES